MKAQSYRYEVKVDTHSGPLLSPLRLFGVGQWQKNTTTESNPESSCYFPYHTDVLLTASLERFNSLLFTPKKLNDSTNHLWLELDPHHQVYANSQSRIQGLLKSSDSLLMKEFEDQILEEWRGCFSSQEEASSRKNVHSLEPKTIELDLEQLPASLHLFEQLESKLKKPLLFQLQMQFSPHFMECIHSLFSLLFHLRAYIAADHNQHCREAAFDALKLDSVADYFPRTEYVANDALLYQHFQEWSSLIPVEKMWIKGLDTAFRKYTAFGYHLYFALGEKFFTKARKEELADILCAFQMDWLLGSPAGLLYRLREELFGISEGYQEVFWHDLAHLPKKPVFTLKSQGHYIANSIWVNKAV